MTGQAGMHLLKQRYGLSLDLLKTHAQNLCSHYVMLIMSANKNHLQLSSFWSLLENCGDDRAKHRDEFKVVVIHPHWSKITHDPDSGITVMRLIDLLGEPESELELFRLQEVLHYDTHNRIYLKSCP